MYGAFQRINWKKDSPLKLRLANLAKLISKIGYVCAFLLSISYLFSVFVLNNRF